MPPSTPPHPTVSSSPPRRKRRREPGPRSRASYASAVRRLGSALASAPPRTPVSAMGGLEEIKNETVDLVRNCYDYC
jgi:hypothetical protein